MRVLIIKASAMGDILHALPVLDYLRQVAPGIEIDWVVEEPFRDILEGNPAIAQLHVVKTRAWRSHLLNRKTWREIGEVKAALQGRDYDLVFDIQGNFKSGLIGWLSGGHDRLGFTAEKLQERINLLFTTRQVPTRPQDHHITDQYLRLVSVPFGKDFRGMELRTDICTTPEDDAAAEALLATLGNGLVFLFHYGTTWQTKFWTEEGWIKLAKMVLEKYHDASVLFSWGNEAERQVVSRLVAAIGAGARTVDRCSLKALTALLKKVDLVAGGDTGPVHLAAAVGTPTVSFYRSTDGRRSGPRGNRHIIVRSPLYCAACFRTNCDQDQKCRESISPEQLLSSIDTLFSRTA